jgi:hypothetical protein
MPAKKMAIKKEECCDYVRKKQLLGCFLFLLGFLWYANETNLFGVTVEHFWPDMLMLVGAIIFFKALFIKYRKK